MRPETWEKLNGSGWGDLLYEGAAPSTTFAAKDNDIEHKDPDMGLNVPGFMYETTQSVLIPAAAYYARGKGSVKRAQHRWDKQVRHVVNGVFWFLVGVAGFAMVCNLALRLADLLGKMV